MTGRPGSTVKRRVEVIDGTHRKARSDLLATEEPLEVRVRSARKTTVLGVTMRTPGADFELAVGLLFSEGIIAGRHDVERIAYCDDVDEQDYNIVTVTVPVDKLATVDGLSRRMLTTSACGVCGTTTLDALEQRGSRAVVSDLSLAADLLATLPERLRARQTLFDGTGGVHAAALFTAAGDLVDVREDVGRHNAVDKLVGAALLDNRMPLSERVLLVSGRSSYEIVQKAAAAGAPVLCSVSAPSSLAVQTAERFGVTLVGFLRGEHMTIYTHSQRIMVGAAPT